MVIDKLSEAILRSEFRHGDTAVADVEDGQIILKQAPEVALVGDSKV
jgi:hypothetical protein